jgi:hypothetical protein
MAAKVVLHVLKPGDARTRVSPDADRRRGLLGMARAGIEPEASPEAEPREPVRAELFLRKDDAVGYWEGEPEPR